MFSDFFAGNLIVGFIISVIVITSYSNFAENQQVFLIYLMVFGLAFFKVTSIRICGVLLLISTFLLLEYLTTDRKKLELVTSFRYKTLDYLYLMIFQLHAFVFFLSLLLLFVSHIKHGRCSKASAFMAIIALFLCEHLIITQPFKTSDFSELARPFELKPLYLFNCTPEARLRYEMLCCFEDHTYFERTKSYSFFSVEYLRIYGIKRILDKIFRRLFHKNAGGSCRRGIFQRILNRGYSTPEMQLIRTIGVKRGYSKYKFFRKCFEIVYSKIFFGSLRKYQVDNAGSELNHFREYILDIYLKNVLTQINGRRFSKFCEAFENPDNVEEWPLEGVFVACLGLSFRYVNDYQLSLFAEIIEEFDLSEQKIYEYSDLIEQGKRIPCYRSTLS